MKFKENTSMDPMPEVTGTVVEIKLDTPSDNEEVSNTETCDVTKDVAELTKLLSEVIVTASELITKLNKSCGK